MILLRGKNEVLNYFAFSEIETVTFQSICREEEEEEALILVGLTKTSCFPLILPTWSLCDIFNGPTFLSVATGNGSSVHQ